MSRKEDLSLDDIRDAKPPLWPPADQWVDSEQGQRVFARVLDADLAAEPRRRARTRRGGRITAPRLAFAGGLVVVIAVAAVVTILVAGRTLNDTGGQVAATQTTAPADQQVTLEAAVADMLPLYSRALQQSADAGSTTSGDLSPADQAVTLGMLSPEEVSADAMKARLTDGDYAVVLVKAFGKFLPLDSFPAQSIDPEASPDERTAIDALMTSGVIVPGDGAFQVSLPLTESLEQRLLASVRDIIGNLSQEQ
jgi:hypothetical protein